MSNKLLAGAAIAGVIGASLVVAPFVTGNKMEDDFRRMAREHARTGTLELYLLSYERGYYTSNAVTRLQMPGKDGEAVSVDLNHRIVHGLGMGGLNYGQVTTTPKLEGEVGATLGRHFGDKMPLRVVTTFGLGGGLEGQIYSAPAEGPVAVPQGAPGQMQWLGLTGSFGVNGDKIAFELKAPGLVGSTAQGQAAMRDVAVNANMFRSADSGIWLGGSSASVGMVEYNQGAEHVRLGGLSFGGESSEAGGAVKLSIAYQLDGFTGNGAEVQDFALRISLSNLDAAALKTYSEAMDKASAASPEEQPLLMMQSVQQLLPALLARRPALTVDEGRMSYNGIPVSLSGRVAYVGDVARGFNPMSDIEGEATLQAPHAMLEQVFVQRARNSARQAMSEETAAAEAPVIEAEARRQAAAAISQYLAQGLLLEASAGVYRAALRFGSGGLTVNGQPVGGPG